VGWAFASDHDLDTLHPLTFFRGHGAEALLGAMFDVAYDEMVIA
jgi:hypothetical protein